MPLFPLLQAQQSFFLYRPKRGISQNPFSLLKYVFKLQFSPKLPNAFIISLAINLKDIELARVMTASSKSSLFGLSRGDVLYEDEWLIAVNKLKGIIVIPSWILLLAFYLTRPSQIGSAKRTNPAHYSSIWQIDWVVPQMASWLLPSRTK